MIPHPRPYSLPLDDDELALLKEGIEMLRLYQQGMFDYEGRLKLKEVARLQTRLLRIGTRKRRAK
jgi:hypothetical protein